MVWLETYLINSQDNISDVGSSLKYKHFSNVFVTKWKEKLFTCCKFPGVFSDFSSFFLALWQPTAQFPRLPSTVVYFHLQVQGLLCELFSCFHDVICGKEANQSEFSKHAPIMSSCHCRSLCRVTLELRRLFFTLKWLLFGFSLLKLRNCAVITLINRVYSWF